MYCPVLRCHQKSVSAISGENAPRRTSADRTRNRGRNQRGAPAIARGFRWRRRSTDRDCAEGVFGEVDPTVVRRILHEDGAVGAKLPAARVLGPSAAGQFL